MVLCRASPLLPRLLLNIRSSTAAPHEVPPRLVSSPHLALESSGALELALDPSATCPDRISSSARRTFREAVALCQVSLAEMRQVLEKLGEPLHNEECTDIFHEVRSQFNGRQTKPW